MLVVLLVCILTWNRCGYSTLPGGKCVTLSMLLRLLEHNICCARVLGLLQIYTGLDFCGAWYADCCAGFSYGGRRGVSLVMLFCAPNGECFAFTALAGCWLKPVPYFDTA